MIMCRPPLQLRRLKAKVTGDGRHGRKRVGIYAPTALGGLGRFHALHAGGELVGLGLVTHWLTPGSAVTQTYSSP